MKNLGIGHGHKRKHKSNYECNGGKQGSFFKTNWKHHLSHGGTLRNKRAGRVQRPLSTKESLHVVFKLNSIRLRHRSLRATRCFALSNQIIKKYAMHFGVKIEQLSIQSDHIHALIRTTSRSQFHHFFRVVAGQIAQRFQSEGLLSLAGVTDTPKNSHQSPGSLWKYRPFSRVIKGWKAYKIVRNYIQLNEKEVRGEFRYQKQRLRGLSSSDWRLLWS